jgi:hypothetical protein
MHSSIKKLMSTGQTESLYLNHILHVVAIQPMQVIGFMKGEGLI